MTDKFKPTLAKSGMRVEQVVADDKDGLSFLTMSSLHVLPAAQIFL